MRFAQAAAGAMGVSPEKFRGMTRTEVMSLIGLEEDAAKNRSKAEREESLRGYLGSLFRDKWGVDLDTRVSPSGIETIDKMLQGESDRVSEASREMSRARAARAMASGNYNHPDVYLNVDPGTIAVDRRWQAENRAKIEQDQQRERIRLEGIQQKYSDLQAKNYEATARAVDAYRSVEPVMGKSDGLSAAPSEDTDATDRARRAAAREALTSLLSGFRRQGIEPGEATNALDSMVSRAMNRQSSSSSMDALSEVYAGGELQSRSRVDSVDDIFKLKGAALEMGLNRLMDAAMDLQQKGALRAGSNL